MSDVSDLSEKMESVRAEWVQIKEKLSDHSRKLKEASIHAEKFNGELDTMKMWLMLNEEKLSEMGPLTLDKDDIAKQLKHIQVCIKYRSMFITPLAQQSRGQKIVLIWY